MKVTLNWLKQYVDFDWSPEELAERLTLLGLEVEGVHKTGGEFDGIVVAQILTRDPVPGSDRSEEHTSELQSLRQLVYRLLLEKKLRRMPLLITSVTYLLPSPRVRRLCAD